MFSILLRCFPFTTLPLRSSKYDDTKIIWKELDARNVEIHMVFLLLILKSFRLQINEIRNESKAALGSSDPRKIPSLVPFLAKKTFPRKFITRLLICCCPSCSNRWMVACWLVCFSWGMDYHHIFHRLYPECAAIVHRIKMSDQCTTNASIRGMNFRIKYC